jgi:hypothetical protein
MDKYVEGITVRYPKWILENWTEAERIAVERAVELLNEVTKQVLQRIHDGSSSDE